MKYKGDKMYAVYGYIYKITNRLNGKVYIGATTKSVIQRWKQHACCSAKSANLSCIQDAILIDGVHNFDVATLKTCFSMEQLTRSEKYFIDYFGSRLESNGYNKSKGSRIKAKKYQMGKTVLFDISDLDYCTQHGLSAVEIARIGVKKHIEEHKERQRILKEINRIESQERKGEEKKIANFQKEQK